MPITTSPTRPVQTPRVPPQQASNTNYAQNGAIHTVPQAQARLGNVVPAQGQVPAQYPAQQTAPQLQTPPRPASSSPPSNTLSVNNRTPSPNSTPPSQSSPSPSPQRPAHLSAQSVTHAQQQQQHAPQQVSYPQQQQQQQQYAPQPPRPAATPYPVNTPAVHPNAVNAAVKPVVSTAQPSPQPIMQQPPQVQIQQQPINQAPVAPVHEQATQEDLQSIPDDMLMALDEAQTLLNEHQSHQARVNEQLNTVQPPQVSGPVSGQPEQHMTPVNHEPAPQHSVNPAVNDELERLRRKIAQLEQDKSKEDLVRTQLQHARDNLATTLTQLTNMRNKESQIRREKDQLQEQLMWKEQELREVRMTQLEQAPFQPSTDTRMLDASDADHVVYNVNTESDESEPVNDHSTHVLNLRMKVGTGNTQANNSATAGGKHSPNNLQQLQIQGTAKNRSPTANKNSKSSPTQPSSTKKATVPSKGHKRSRDEMSRGHEETDEIGEPSNKEAERLKLVSRD